MALAAEKLAAPRDARAVCREVFGFDEFRAGQESVIGKLLAGRSVLSIFPTGGGKSLCYQLPALMLDGLTVVVSPLIALMKDQVDFLVSRGVAAARLDSSLDQQESFRLFDDFRAGRLKLLYISPERLGNERFLHSLRRRGVDLLAIDEAHCISEWGHNFRPDYLKIAHLPRQLQVSRVLALTATATPQVARDIASAFDIATEDVVHTGFYRANLKLCVTPCAADTRLDLLRDRLSKRPPGPTIVYVTLQRTAEEVAAFLVRQGFDARPYHAGMEATERNATQDAFMASERMIVVATIAFGMGVDKADIRQIYHFNLPKGLESYMQEIGRAGRDGHESVCELFACIDDVAVLENFSYGDTPTPEAVAALVADVLDRGQVFDVSVYDLSRDHDLRLLVVSTLLTYLELEGIIESTGAFYSEYKLQYQHPPAEIVARFDADRAAFLQSLFRHARTGRTWSTLNIAEVSGKTGSPRERVVKALGYLEEHGDIVLQTAGLRQGYRNLRPSCDRVALCETLSERFARREQHDIERVGRVVAFARHAGCLTAALLAYFGEQRGRCGHCAPCLGAAPPPLSAAPPAVPEREEIARVNMLCAEGHPALATPRQLARFLCGILSPATSRARLRGHRMFGCFEAIPFQEVLKLAEQVIPAADEAESPEHRARRGSHLCCG